MDKKMLYLSKSFSDLQKLAETAKLDTNNVKMACTLLDKLYEKHEQAFLDHNEELAYIYAISFLYSRSEMLKLFKSDINYINAVVSSNKTNTCLDRVENLTSSLKERYDALLDKKDVVAAVVDVEDITVDKVRGSVTAMDVYSQLDGGKNEVMIGDTIPEVEFAQCRINGRMVVNVPLESLQAGGSIVDVNDLLKKGGDETQNNIVKELSLITMAIVTDVDQGAEKTLYTRDQVPGGWRCNECTYNNKREDVKCAMCHLLRLVEDCTGEYNSKVEKYMSKINPLFIQLDDIDGAPFENIVREYQHVAIANPNFMNWYKDRYLDGKSVSMVGDIIEEVNHNITLNDLGQRYVDHAKAKNNEILSTLPRSVITPDMIGSMRCLQIDDINKNIAVPNDMKNKEINIDQLWKVMSQKKQYTEPQIRMLMTELNLPHRDNVKFLSLIIVHPELGPYLERNCPGSVKIEHVRQTCLDQILLDDAVNFLKKECGLCCEDLPMPEMQPLLICAHEMCKNCFKSWLEENIRSRYPCKWGCPNCPEESYAIVDKTLHYSNLKEFLLNNDCDNSLIKIFDEKLLNERLMGSPLFHWCANEQCVNGFEAEGQNSKVQCPSCRLHMCVKCNREWKPQHENASCEEYEMWILRNDPNLAKVLNDIGIECPNCKMRYALAPGGCLHFECKKCGWVFCGGCDVEFTSKCQVDGCTLGSSFHGHHPRNCLYYMRDYTPTELENMLKDKDYPKLNGKAEKICPFITADDKLLNKPCGDKVHGTSGLCQRHYKEYLVTFINRLNVDPAVIANSQSLNLMLMQAIKKQLVKGIGESEDAFVVRLRATVKQTCPLYVPKQFGAG